LADKTCQPEAEPWQKIKQQSTMTGQALKKERTINLEYKYEGAFDGGANLIEMVRAMVVSNRPGSPIQSASAPHHPGLLASQGGDLLIPKSESTAAETVQSNNVRNNVTIGGGWCRFHANLLLINRISVFCYLSKGMWVGDGRESIPLCIRSPL
jgi:hypothetical protein